MMGEERRLIYCTTEEQTRYRGEGITSVVNIVVIEVDLQFQILNHPNNYI